MTDIDLLVIHCTELPDLAMAREYGERIHYQQSGTGNSGHFYVDRDGSMEQWVPPERIAHHVRGLNAGSLGVELVHRGRYPDWFDSRRQEDFDPYPQRQIEALKTLILWLETEIPSLRRIAGHEDLDRERVTASYDEDRTVPRKSDPGPTFPWEQIMKNTKLTRVTAVAARVHGDTSP